ncbi:MAG TPA: hypothetical protein VNB49_08845, partial [Candidatus Dormibacteraeota bacterium]|nr:hypothetical protein [Candidatus Dormibacteraeota bacterium]
AGVQPVVPACEEMAQLMSKQNSKERGGKGQTREETGGILIEERERSQELVDGDGLIVRVSYGKLRARDEAGA